MKASKAKIAGGTRIPSGRGPLISISQTTAAIAKQISNVASENRIPVFYRSSFVYHSDPIRKSSASRRSILTIASSLSNCRRK